MRKFLAGFCGLCFACSVLPSVSAQTVEPAPTVQGEQAKSDAAGGKRAREFQGDDLGQVLRLLARQAKVNLAVGEAVKGTVNVYLENVSAMDAIEVLVRLNKLSMTKDDKGVYYLNVPEPATETLGWLAKPETVNQIAVYKRRLYDALVKQGFDSAEAVQIVATSDSGAILAVPAKRPEPTLAK